MQFSTKLVIIIVCEGKSEANFVNSLFKSFGKNNISLKVHVANGWRGIERKVKSIKKDNPRTRIEIIMDYDVIKRGECKKTRFAGITPRYNYFNYEDFLMLYQPKNVVLAYQEKCESFKHFDSPMKSGKIEEVIRDFFPNYEKGKLPFTLDEQAIINLQKNNKDPEISFHSDFVDLLEEIGVFSMLTDNALEGSFK